MAQKRILYIEDYPVVQQMYLEVLRRAFTVDVANDGKEALEKIKEHHYDIILLDLLLPNVSGVEFLRTYKNGGHLQDASTHIIVLSDFNNPATMKEVKELGVKDYWIKVENTPHALVENLNKVLYPKDA